MQEMQHECSLTWKMWPCWTSGQGKRCALIHVNTTHGTHIYRYFGHVWCKCWYGAMTLKIVKWECLGGGRQKWPSINIKHGHDWYWWNGAGRQMCIAEEVIAGIQPHIAVCGMLWMSWLSKCAAGGYWYYCLANMSSTALQSWRQWLLCSSLRLTTTVQRWQNPWYGSIPHHLESSSRHLWALGRW